MGWLLALIACGGGKSEDTGSTSSAPWTGGEFDFFTETADDGCLDGALNVLFMPGEEAPHPFEYPIYLPSYDEVPLSYTIDLRDPFREMPVTVDANPDGVFEVRGSVMEAVALGTSYGDCVVTMRVDADISPTSHETARGSAWISISNPQGDEEMCPVFSSADCEVTLDLSATKR